MVGAGVREAEVQVLGPRMALSGLWILFWVEGNPQEDSSRGLGAPAVWCFRRTPGCWTETRIETEMDWEAVAREIQG